MLRRTSFASSSPIASPDPYLVLSGAQLRDLLPSPAPLGIAGGATYDALIGLAAEAVGARTRWLDA